MKKKEIEHKGRVTSIREGTIKVTIQSNSACSGCHAKGACGMGDSVDKVIDVKQHEYPDVQVNQEVNVVISKSEGVLAVTLAYLIPVALIVLTLSIFDYLKINELVSFFVMIGVVAIYYLILHKLRDKIFNKINIEIRY